MDITPILLFDDPNDPDDPIRRQWFHCWRIQPFKGMMEDSLAEDRHSHVPPGVIFALLHRYPDRVLMLVTTQCASYCRYCTRSRIVGDPTAQFPRLILYSNWLLRKTPQVVMLFGGWRSSYISPKKCGAMLKALREIPHIVIFRIGSGVLFLCPSVAPMNYAKCCKISSIMLNIHVNLPNEITADSWKPPVTN